MRSRCGQPPLSRRESTRPWKPSPSDSPRCRKRPSWCARKSTPHGQARGPSQAPPARILNGDGPPIHARDLLWLALALLVIIGTGIGIRDPWPADEPRFASIARDMVATGEWLFPRVGGDLYQDKPPLFFWMLAVGYSLIGSIKWSFLVPSFIAAGSALYLIYDF